MINWETLDLVLEPIERLTLGETSLSCPPSYLFLGLGPNDPRDFVIIGEKSNTITPDHAILHKIWPLRIKFFQTSTGRRLKTLIETQTCIYLGFATQTWCFRLCQALMSHKPEILEASKENININFNQIFFTHFVYFPDDYEFSENRKKTDFGSMKSRSI